MRINRVGNDDYVVGKATYYGDEDHEDMSEVAMTLAKP